MLKKTWLVVSMLVIKPQGCIATMHWNSKPLVITAIYVPRFVNYFLTYQTFMKGTKHQRQNINNRTRENLKYVLSPVRDFVATSNSKIENINTPKNT